MTTNRLPHDTYYRGYRLTHMPDGPVVLHYGTDRVTEEPTEAAARATIDGYHDAA